ncbi:MAG: site-specific integrase [Candidatus Methanomethylophilaceae archaeon]|nr:site-specific integrase [Candidatus Methanomethylophilaceae archaeon]
MDEHGLTTDPRRIGPRELNAVYALFQEEGLAVSTGKGYVNALKLYCSAAGNYSKKKKLPWSTDYRPNADWLTNSQCRKLMKADLNPEQRMIVHLELCLGLRRVDSIRLRSEYIDWEGRKLTVLGKGHGKGKFRDVDFNTTDAPGMNTERVFRDYMEYREAMITVARGRDPSAKVPDRLLIYMSRGRLGAFSEKGVAIDNRIKEVSAIVGVPFSNHTLRRTFGRNLFQNGVKVEDIAAILGHKDTKTTLRYLGLDRVDHSSHMNMLDFGEEEED